jgi:hypothetical protein
MTILEAIAGEIEPYSLSDNAVEKSLLDSCAHFGVTHASGDDYTADCLTVVALAAMYCLSKLIVLSAENIGGISQSYSTSELEARIRGIASRTGLSPGLAIDADGSSNVINCIDI